MRHLFLQGDRDIGKSTIIREVVLPYIKDVGGFFTVKLYKDKNKMGFAIRDIKDAKDYVLQTSIRDINQVQGLFMHKQKGKWCFNTDAFSTKALKNITEISNNKLIIMDEVGGLELKDLEFVRQLKLCLNGKVPLLGVLKSQKNLTNLHKQTNYDIDMFSLSEYMKEKDNIEILTLTNDNRSEIQNKVKNFVENTMASI